MVEAVSPPHGPAHIDAEYPGQVVDPGSQKLIARLGLRVPTLLSATKGDEAFAQLAAVAEQAERSGFDSLWVDDLVPGVGNAGRSPEPVFEAYTLLGALAVRTDTIGLGALPWGGNARPPSLLAKIVSGVDVISHGRAVLSLGTGPADDVTSVGRLAEELQVCRALLTEDSPSFDGEYFRIANAPNRPRPVRVGGVPLVVTVDRPEAVGPVARFADALVVTGDASAVAAMRFRLTERCRAADRDPAEVRLVWAGDVTVDGRPGGHRAAGRLGELMESGADGCIVSLVGANDLDAVAEAGSVLRAAMGEYN